MSQIGMEYNFAGSVLQCPICKHTHFEQEKTLLNSQSTPSEDTGQANESTDTYICTNCGYILWFLPTAINQPGHTYMFQERPLLCPLCGWQEFAVQQVVMSTRSATFMQFDWAQPDADIAICTRCGFMQWSLALETGRPGQTYEISGRQLTCIRCGQIHFRERQTLMKSKGTTTARFDWTDSTANNYVCVTCGTLQWFA